MSYHAKGRNAKCNEELANERRQHGTTITSNRGAVLSKKRGAEKGIPGAKRI